MFMVAMGRLLLLVLILQKEVMTMASNEISGTTKEEKTKLFKFILLYSLVLLLIFPCAYVVGPSDFFIYWKVSVGIYVGSFLTMVLICMKQFYDGTIRWKY